MKIISVAFKENGKEYYFKNKSNLDLKKGDKVVVDTAHGIELASVVNIDILNNTIPENNLMPVMRFANKKDLKNYEDNKRRSKEGFELFNKILQDFPKLDMTLVSCSYNLDQSKIQFMYVSDERVDFRELLKALATNFKKRIELKQIGARDKAKLIGGLGPCGMETCCTRYLKDFENISINMAKNQMLSLNPTKISGLCGRLLCCLKYENETYSTEKVKFPRLGSVVTYENNDYKVMGVNIITNDIKIETDGIIRIVKKEELKWK